MLSNLFKNTTLRQAVQNLNPLSDVTAKQIRRREGKFKNIRGRAKAQLTSNKTDTTTTGIVRFSTPSGTGGPRVWKQKVKMVHFRKLYKKYKDSKPLRWIVNQSLKRDVVLDCNCPAYLYWGWKYKATQQGYALHEETRFPKIRNPKLKGSVCKHLENVLLTLPFLESEITKDLKSKGL